MWHIPRTWRTDILEGFCIKVIGDLYGFPPAGQNSSKEFDRCLAECEHKNNPSHIATTSGDLAQQITSTSGSKTSKHPISMGLKSRMRQTSDKEFVGIRIQADYYMDQFIDRLKFQTGANADFKSCIGQISTSLFIRLSQKVLLCMMKRLKSQDVYFQSGKIGHRSTKIQLRSWNRMNKFPTV